VTIGQETSEIRRREKGLNTRSISQWPSVSQTTGGHNKTGQAGHSVKKFAANIPYIIGNLCSKFGDNWFIFKKVTTKKSMDPSSWTRDWPPSVLNLRRLWSVYIISSVILVVGHKQSLMRASGSVTVLDLEGPVLDLEGLVLDLKVQCLLRW